MYLEKEIGCGLKGVIPEIDRISLDRDDHMETRLKAKKKFHNCILKRVAI